MNRHFEGSVTFDTSMVIQNLLGDKHTFSLFYFSLLTIWMSNITLCVPCALSLHLECFSVLGILSVIGFQVPALCTCDLLPLLRGPKLTLVRVYNTHHEAFLFIIYLYAHERGNLLVIPPPSSSTANIIISNLLVSV